MYTSSTLSELELPSGRVLHCWDCEELLVEKGAALRDDLLFFDSLTSYDDQILLSTPVQTFCFSPTAAWFGAGPIPIGTWPNNRILTLYQSPGGRGPDVLYGFGGPNGLYGFENACDAQFDAVMLPKYGCAEERTQERTQDRSLWKAEHFYVYGAELDSIDDDAFPPSILHGWGTYSSGKCGFGCNQTIMSETLYALQWQWEDPDEVGVVPVLQPDALGIALFVLALDPVTGMSKWRCPCPTLRGPIQLAAADQLLFILSPQETVAFSVQTREPNWRWQADFEVRHGLIADGLLYVLGAQGQIAALDLYTGQMSWSWQVTGEIVRAFSTIDQGTLYIATPTTLYAVS